MPYRKPDPPPAPDPQLIDAYFARELTKLVSSRPIPWVVGDGRPERDDASTALWTWRREGELGYSVAESASANVTCHYDLFVLPTQQRIVVSHGNHKAGVIGRHWFQESATIFALHLVDVPDPSLAELRRLLRAPGVPLSELLWELIERESPNMEWPT